MPSTYPVLKALKRAMRLIGVLNVGDVPTPDEEQDGLEAMNSLVDSWQTYRLNIYTSLQAFFTLAPGQQSYEIGPNAVDWVAQRPVFIDGASMLFSGSTANLERPIRVCTDEQWRMIQTKTLSTSFVTDLWYDRGFSNPDLAQPTSVTDIGSGRIWVYPIPSATGQIELYLPQAVSQFTSINQALALPPGYQRALTSALAIEIAPEYNVTPSAALLATYAEAMEFLQRANVQITALRCDPAVTRNARGRFNVWIGE